MLSNSQTNLFFLLLSEIGVGLAGFGVAFLFLGMLLLFDKGLLAVGNVGISPFQVVCILFHYSTLSLQILFLSGLAFVIGLERTFRFFFQYHKIKGSSAFFGGIVVVLLGYPLIGMIIEAYGFIVLFSGFFPVAVNFLRRIPVIGTILNLPGISSVSYSLLQIDIFFMYVQSYNIVVVVRTYVKVTGGWGIIHTTYRRVFGSDVVSKVYTEKKCTRISVSQSYKKFLSLAQEDQRLP